MTSMLSEPSEPSQDPNAFGFDRFEKDLLCIARCLLTSVETPESQSWHHAFVIAVEKWGEPLGLAVAHAMAKLVRALLRARSEGLYFHDPFDIDSREHISEDEYRLLAMLHHMRRDDAKRARPEVEALTLGRMDPDVIRAGLGFAARFSCGTQVRQQKRCPPKLHIVQ